MATINNIKKRANEIKNAYEPESVTAEDVGSVAYDLAEVAEQQATALSDTAEGTDLALRRSDALQETLHSIGAEGGAVQSAGAVALDTGTGLVSTDVQQGMKELATAIFPVTATFHEGNAGTFEVGDEIAPRMVLDIRRNGVNVQSSATVTVSPEVANPITVVNNRKVITDATLTSGNKTYTINVRQGGQDATPLTATYAFMNYRYKGALSSKPNTANIVAAIQALPKELSTVTTLGQTTLEGGKYYLFAVKGNVDLIVKNAKSGGTISIPNSDKGKVQVPQENDPTVTNLYSWVIVPASSSTWYFQITNS